MPTFDPAAREREANAELERSTSTAGARALLLAGALLILLAGPALELVALARGRSEIFTSMPPASATTPDTFGAREQAGGAPMETLPMETLWGRRLERWRLWCVELERRFDERSALVRLSRPPAQRALLRVADYGNEQVYVGSPSAELGRWLFYRPDFEHLTGKTDATARALEAILALRDDLAKREIALVVLPAPVKLAIEGAHFARGAPAPPLRPLAERRLLEQLTGAGVALLDPAPSLARRQSAGETVYLAHDTHWRPEAVDAVARDLALLLRDLVSLPPGDRDRYIEEHLAIEGLGDLTVLLGGAATTEGLLPRERIELRSVRSVDGRAWQPERGAPVLLLGDSFSAVFSQPDLGWGSGAGLADRLAFHLGLPIDRITRNAGGASATREALAAELARDPARLDGVRVVVYELAAREITQGEWLEVELPVAPPRSR
jgi:alginate O-acetyltransferase complex protein AlgJ